MPECLPEPDPDPELDPGGDTYWRRELGGALTCVQGDTRLLALPYGTPQLPMERAREIRVIEGRRYAIFHFENGRII